ncbi:nucleolar transcription factor 1-like [Anopheles darlingi]|uniref:nucleolar transcription factor 1-like n=1 Tax=Anopheles darlingi TaxID=43151 RepID=UPI002100261B|nr:nucleolar transcription factor 1-like [Anopheles darlingi]
MRKRSLSVAYERSNNADSFSKKFEGVASDADEDATDYEEENEEDEEEIDEGGTEGEAGAGSDELWPAGEYEKLLNQLRSVLPKNDKRSHSSRLKVIEWDKVAFDGHSAENVKQQTYGLLKKVRKFRTLAELLDDVPQVIKKRMRAEMPKAPLSSYIHFMKEVYSSYQQRYQTVSPSDLVKIIARDFAQLSEKKKAKYERMAAESKKTYQIEMEKYHQEHPESSQTNKRNRSKARSRALKVTPFNVFCSERRETEPKLSHAELKKSWSELGMNHRLKYIRKAYANADADAVNLTKTEKEMLDKAIGKPEAVGRSCSDYYVKFHAEPDIQIPIIEWRKLKIQEFKSLPKMRRLELELEFRKARAKFVTDYQKYIEALPDRERDKEIQFLQGYMESVLDKEEKKRLQMEGGGGGNSTRTAHNVTVNDTVVDAHPLAESTINHFDTPGKSKSMKKDASLAAMAPPPTVPNPTKPLKSILKSPSPVKGASSKRAIIEEPDTSATEQVAKKKQKKADTTTSVAAEPSPVREKKSSKSKSQPASAAQPSNEDDREGSDSGAGKKKQNAPPVMSEPRAPPKKLLDYFIQEHYSGKRSKAEEAFNKLSSNRRKEMQRELKTAHKRYVLELEAYFKTLPKHQIEKYLKKIEAKKGDDSAEEDDSEDDNTSGELPANGTKQEPQDSSSGESDDSDDD